MDHESPEVLPNTLSLVFLEGLYADYLRDPNSVSEDYRNYFASIARDDAFQRSPQIGPSFKPASVFNPTPARSNGYGAVSQATNGAAAITSVSDMAVRQDRVDALIRAYRVRGHMIAKIDPLGLPRPNQAELDPEFYELTAEDLERKFSSRTIFGAEALTLREMLNRLRNTYCRSIGVQFMHIDDLRVKNWLQDRMEGSENRIQLSRDEQLRILTR
jgi:2-oxoglutarate dehydrogenase E1 component